MSKRIKRLPNIDRRAYKGLFKPLNPQKYKGNHKNIIYRSSWEKRFMGYCDKKKEIIEWGSEEFALYYRGVDNKIHRYYPDFFMKVRQPNGTHKKFLIEIKPKNQTRKPKPGKIKSSYYKRALLTYETNRRKWATAFAWCKKRNMTFKILTEDHLKTF